MRVQLAAALAFFAFPATAQEPALQGIGFAQAEALSFHCRHEDPLEALACASEHCAEADPSQECVSTVWCYPAGWSGVMSVSLPEAQTTTTLCGITSEKALTDALMVLCAANDEALRCELSLTVDPDGNELQVEGVRFPGGAPQSEDAASDVSGGEGEPQLAIEATPILDAESGEAIEDPE